MKKTLVLFDFDGTISLTDSTYGFYRFLYKSTILFLYNHYFSIFQYVLSHRLNLISYVTLKSIRLDKHTSRFNDIELSMLSEEYYIQCFAKLLNPRALERIHWHKSQGHELWVISASFDFLLQRWAKENDFNIIANETLVNNLRRQIKGVDVNYEAKVAYLKEKVNLKNYSEIYAYGDSEGDMALLNIANHKFYKPFKS